MLATTGAEAVMVGRGAQGNPWALKEIVDGDASAPSREEVVAELVLFVREAVRELGERRASGFLKKFYGWYLGQGRFPKPFKQEVLRLESTEEVERRLIAAAPGALELLERLEDEVPPGDEFDARAPDLRVRRRLVLRLPRERSRHTEGDVHAGRHVALRAQETLRPAKEPASAAGRERPAEVEHEGDRDEDEPEEPDLEGRVDSVRIDDLGRKARKKSAIFGLSASTRMPWEGTSERTVRGAGRRSIRPCPRPG